MTDTYAILDISGSAYAAIRILMKGAGHEQAFHREQDVEVIDMHGIALRARHGSSTACHLTVSALLSSATKEGRIELSLNGEVTQMDLDKARHIVTMLQSAIEAAISDQLIYRFLVHRDS